MAMRAHITAKVEGHEIVSPLSEEPKPSDVINLADALRKSLEMVEAKKRKVTA